MKRFIILLLLIACLMNVFTGVLSPSQTAFIALYFSSLISKAIRL